MRKLTLPAAMKVTMFFVLPLFLVRGAAAQCIGTYSEPSNGFNWTFSGATAVRFDGACAISGGLLTCNNGFNASVTLTPSDTCNTITTSLTFLQFAKVKSQAVVAQYTKLAAEAWDESANAQIGVFTVCPIIAIVTKSIAASVVCVAAFEALAAYFNKLASSYNKAAADPPDANFTVIAAPVIPTLRVPIPSGASPSDIAFLNSVNILLADLAQQIGYSDAASTAFNRAQGAINAGSVEWWQKQTEASFAFNAQAAGAIGAEPTLLANLEVAFWRESSHTSFALSQSDFSTLLASVNATGLSPAILQDLAQLGDDGSAAAAYIAFLNDPTTVNNFPASVPEVLVSPNLINDLIQLAGLLDTPFSAFSAKFETTTRSFELASDFTLGPNSSINPATDIVTLQIGTFAETFPGGSFIRNHRGYFVFSGRINGVAQEIIIKPGANNSYTFNVEAAGVNLTTLKKPVSVMLNVGNDLGLTQVNHED